jgi:hypothetical protein
MKIIRSILAVLAVTILAIHPLFGGGAPEIDPATGIGMLAFLGGAILVIRGRVKL